MAEQNKNLKEQKQEQEQQLKDHKKDQEKMIKSAEKEARKDVKELKVEAKGDQLPPKPYIHIDTFLQTAIPMYNLSGVQAAGFKAKMNGKHYQRDEKVFIKALKEHFNIKDDEKN
jgi:hypothetical protein